MRNLTVVVDWHGGSPKVSTNCIDPKGSTFFSRESLQVGVDWLQPLPSDAHLVKS